VISTRFEIAGREAADVPGLVQHPKRIGYLSSEIETLAHQTDMSNIALNAAGTAALAPKV
jgi:hypothetical protein